MNTTVNNPAPPDTISPGDAQFMPTGTVYGTLLNFQSEVAAMQAQMTEPPYKAAPKAPVLYIKPANTWSPSGAQIAIPTHVPQVEVGATISMVIMPLAGVITSLTATDLIAKEAIQFVLMNDLSIPHSSFFRPPVKYKCLDGFLGIGSQAVPLEKAGDPIDFKLEVRINGALVQSLDFSQLVRPAAVLLEDVSEFMTLHPGDVLMLGCDCLPGGGRPLAKVGDRIDISAPNHPAFGTLSNTLVAQAQ